MHLQSLSLALLSNEKKKMCECFQSNSIKNSWIDCNLQLNKPMRITNTWRPIWSACACAFPLFCPILFSIDCLVSAYILVSFHFSNLNFRCISHQTNSSQQTRAIEWCTRKKESQLLYTHQTFIICGIKPYWHYHIRLQYIDRFFLARSFDWTPLFWEYWTSRWSCLVATRESFFPSYLLHCYLHWLVRNIAFKVWFMDQPFEWICKFSFVDR